MPDNRIGELNFGEFSATHEAALPAQAPSTEVTAHLRAKAKLQRDREALQRKRKADQSDPPVVNKRKPQLVTSSESWFVPAASPSTLLVLSESVWRPPQALVPQSGVVWAVSESSF
jgi:hypothetical protein